MSEKEQLSTLIIWGSEKLPPISEGVIYTWNGYVQTDAMHSLLRYIDNHAEQLRKKYLAYIYDLGETVIKGKRLVDHLVIEEGFSYWWMTQLVEKSPFKSPRMYDCLRLIALEEILIEGRFSTLILYSSDADISASAKALCDGLAINFIWQRAPKINREWSLRRFYGGLPFWLQGILSLRHLVKKWPLRKLKKVNWFSGDRDVFICSYFFNLDADLCKKGNFYSHQWGELPALLRQNNSRVNWLHHFLLSPGPDAEVSLSWVSLFNKAAERQGAHAFFESFLSWSVLFRTIKNWFRLNMIANSLKELPAIFKPKNSSVWLWPLLNDDWQASLRGPIAISNCLWMNLFDTAFKSMPRQKKGFYLWENQGWESAFIYVWRKYGHGMLIGVPHSTIVFWHLNNFEDPRVFAEACTHHAKPLPDYLALNGPMAWDSFVLSGCPGHHLFKVEALRFQYLNKFNDAKVKQSDRKIQNLLALDGQIKLLILGDISVMQTLKMLQCVASACSISDLKVVITLKPHPATRIESGDFPLLSFGVTGKPLSEIISDFDFVFCGNTTSASLDALLAGLPVAVFLDDTDINHSPLYKVDGICFVSSPEELLAALNSDRCMSNSEINDFFWLDDQLLRWHNLLIETEVSHHE